MLDLGAAAARWILTARSSVRTLKQMERRFRLSRFGFHFWTRAKAKQIRARLMSQLEALDAGDVLVVDLAEVEAFDFSFADELFGKTIFTLGIEHPGRFVIVENLTECTTENLTRALETLNLAIIERRNQKLRLLGKVHPVDRETFEGVVGGGAVTAGALSKTLQVNLTAMNERLSKLVGLSVVRRERGSSASGREQYVYRALS
jgi:STAS-like domain of unknown function (DUF4325)